MKLVRILLPCALCALLTACESPRTGLDDHDLAVAAQQLESAAGEARWLAQQVQAHSVNAGMAWVHQQALGDDTLKIAHDLAKPAPPRLRAQQAQLAGLAAQLEAQLSRIASSAGEPDQLESLQRSFRELAQAAHPMGSAA